MKVVDMTHCGLFTVSYVSADYRYSALGLRIPNGFCKPRRFTITMAGMAAVTEGATSVVKIGVDTETWTPVLHILAPGDKG